jgi:hypothetical protein
VAAIFAAHGEDGGGLLDEGEAAAMVAAGEARRPAEPQPRAAQRKSVVMPTRSGDLAAPEARQPPPCRTGRVAEAHRVGQAGEHGGGRGPRRVCSHNADWQTSINPHYSNTLWRGAPPGFGRIVALYCR